MNPFLDKFLGGWNLQGLTRWSSGAPFDIRSNRLTTGSLEQTTAVRRNMSASELKKHIGTHRTSNGVFWLDPKSGLVTISGGTNRGVLCTPGQMTPCFDHPGVQTSGHGGCVCHAQSRLYRGKRNRGTCLGASASE